MFVMLLLRKQVKTRVDMFFPNMNRTEVAEIDLDLQTRPSEGPNACELSQISSAIPEISAENPVFCLC